MARAHRLALLTAFFTTLYLLALFQVLPVPLVPDGVLQEVLPVVSQTYSFLWTDGADLGSCPFVVNFPSTQFPWWLLVSFGSYSLWSIGWGLFSFRDCEEAYHELLGVSFHFVHSPKRIARSCTSAYTVSLYSLHFLHLPSLFQSHVLNTTLWFRKYRWLKTILEARVLLWINATSRFVRVSFRYSTDKPNVLYCTLFQILRVSLLNIKQGLTIVKIIFTKNWPPQLFSKPVPEDNNAH